MAVPLKTVSGSRLASDRSIEHLRLYTDTVVLLASESSLDVMMDAALQSSLELSRAAFGVFYYCKRGSDEACHLVSKVSGFRPDPAQDPGQDPAGREFPAELLPQIFSETTDGRGILRIADIAEAPQGPDNVVAKVLATLPFKGLPAVRSYMAVPASCRGGDLVGGMILGHPSPAIFDEDAEDLVSTLAAQAATSIEKFLHGHNLSGTALSQDRMLALQRATADRLRTAIDTAGMGFWSWDHATDMMEFDDRAAQLMGVPPGIAHNRTALRDSLTSPDVAAANTARLQHSVNTGGHYQAEHRIISPSGEFLRWVSASAISTYAPGTKIVVGMVGTMQDITARKMDEANLLESEKLAEAGRLAATVAHEINNPLEAVTNLIYISRTDPAVPERVQKLLKTADEEIARVSKIAQQTLGFYGEAAGPAEIDINALLRGVVNLFSRKMRQKDTGCVLDLQPGACVFAVHGELRQVFSNLLVNAMDATTRGTIRVRTRCRSRGNVKFVDVLIVDQGCGIPASVYARIFSPFVSSKQSAGTGLGLWVTRGILQKLGSSIAFRTSTEPPCGTLFRVCIPVLPQTPAS